MDPESLADEIADAYQYRRRILDVLHNFDEYIKSKSEVYNFHHTNNDYTLWNHSSSTVTGPPSIVGRDLDQSEANGEVPNISQLNVSSESNYNLNLPSINRNVRFNATVNVSAQNQTRSSDLIRTCATTYSTPRESESRPPGANFTPTPVNTVSSNQPLLIDLESVPTNLNTASSNQITNPSLPNFVNGSNNFVNDNFLLLV